MSEHFPPDSLAAYFDGAASSDASDAIEVHLTSCAECRARLAEMSGARRAVQLLPRPSAPADVWGRIDRRLQPGRSSRPRAAARPPRRRGAQPVQAGPPGAPYREGGYDWKLSAVLAVVVALGAILVAGPLGSHIAEAVRPANVGIDYGAYLAGQSDKAAMERFETDYGRRRLPIRSRGALANVLVGSDLLETPPDGLIPRTAFTLSDHGVRAVQVTYVRDRSLVDVFRQPADHPVRFDGYSPRPVDLGGEECLVADGKSHRAVTFTVGRARYVLLVPRGEAGLSDLIRTFAERGDSRAS